MARLLENIVKIFEKVGLVLKVVSEPIRSVRGAAGRNIFQMDVESNVKGIHRHERFRIYPGHKDNLIQVRDKDLKSKQVLLMVQEKANEFEDEQKITKYNREGSIRDDLKKAGFYNIRKVGDKLVFKGKTPAETRYFLMGFDERQLFIAQLKGPATTVLEAKKSLGRTVNMLFGDGKRKGSILLDLPRQGEWWLLETNEIIRNEIERAIRGTRAVVVKKANINTLFNRRGKAHIADELLVLPVGSTNQPGTSENRLLRRRIFVRGGIRHGDHYTKKFNHWREVIENDSGISAQSRSSSGIFYID